MREKAEIKGQKPAVGSRRGSALLIVLGFLSFMVISGVSFAIYMRIERQAASNYRHNITARHLLNAGLARAMEEIDSELRVRGDSRVDWTDNEPTINGADIQTKFPAWKDWPGRVKVSSVVSGNNNSEDARVLSLEALSFIPGVLLNDVRRFVANRSSYDFPGAPKDEKYMGAKWRPLERSFDGEVIGRYAYVCVNVSDMLNVNEIRATQPRDSFINRVSLAHLLDDDKRTWFDNSLSNNAAYLSLQDFYSVRRKRKMEEFKAGWDRSPYHNYLENQGQGLNEFQNAAKHVFIADGLAKAEPARDNGALYRAFNIFTAQKAVNDNGIFKTPDILAMNRPAPGQWGFTPAFLNAFKCVPATETERTFLNNTAVQEIMSSMLKDYLDEDNLPSRLDTPTVERVPMVCQIMMWNPDLWSPKIIVYDPNLGVTPAPSPSLPIEYWVQLFGDSVGGGRVDPAAVVGTLQAPLAIKLVWPFKNVDLRPYLPSSLGFTVEVDAYLALHVPHSIKKTTDFQVSPGTLLKLDCSPVNVPVPTGIPSKQPPDGNNKIVEDDCYIKVDMVLSAVVNGSSNNKQTHYKIGNDATPSVIENPFAGNTAFSVSLIVVVKVKNRDGYYVDYVPWCLPQTPMEITQTFEDTSFSLSPKLYFQTKDRLYEPLSGMNMAPVPYDWKCLEVPDPRFNHNASNWVNSDNVSGEERLNPPTKNKSTEQLLTDNTGRDADIFMSVSNAGYMQSPGELGFIVRPFEGMMADVNASTRDFHPAEPWDIKDEAYMFRTFRLYDHGAGHRRDFIYENFYMADENDTLPGARVNPLSDIPEVLEAAIWNTPAEYWLAATNTAQIAPGWTETERKNMVLFKLENEREAVDEWVDIFQERVKKGVENCYTLDKSGKEQSGTFKIKHDWRFGLSDVYGAWDAFQWYSPNDPNSIFGAKTSEVLHEVDRKMLYSFSLDSFSDRQQLFLYFIRAEATLPALGTGAEGGSRSLAGGRAVALVWRDPYPRGYKNRGGTNIGTEDWDRNNMGWYPKQNDYHSPWVQYYAGDTKDKKIDSISDPRSGSKAPARWTGWHDSRVLFFKLLDQ